MNSQVQTTRVVSTVPKPTCFKPTQTPSRIQKWGTLITQRQLGRHVVCMAQKENDNKKRRKGRPAWTRSPDDTPYRDGNRDRLIGLLTLRAAHTLCYYLSETNPNVYGWFTMFLKDNRIPREGSWDEVSGEAFLRKLLSMPVEQARWNIGREAMYDNMGGIMVDPRQIAQRVMDIRSAIAKEFIQDLQGIAEENSSLMRDTLMESLSASFKAKPDSSASGNGSHPEMNQ